MRRVDSELTAFDPDDAVVVVTGAASGIGAALARKFAARGAKSVVLVDRDLHGAREVAADIASTSTASAVAEQVEVADRAQIAALVGRTLTREGAIDLFCSNAGITTGFGASHLTDPDADDEMWRRAFDINMMSHVHAARAVLPSMLARGRGWLLHTASAAGLLTSPGDAPYAVTKHAAVAFAEWLSMTFGGQGVGVSVLCPMGVATPLLMDPLSAGEPAARSVAASGEIVTADQVADVAVAGLAAGRFLILPHPQVGTYWAQKASDPARWLAGVRRLAHESERGT